MNRLPQVFQNPIRTRPAVMRPWLLISAIGFGVGGCALPSLAVAQEAVLNTLLYTPAQRLAIGQARQGLQATVGSAATVTRPSTTRLDGVVARSRGKGTAWINGAAVAQGTSPTTVIRGTDAVVEGRRLRVGESIDHGTGAKSDIVAPGAVRRRLSP